MEREDAFALLTVARFDRDPPPLTKPPLQRRYPI
jgi:hypothetical protein